MGQCWASAFQFHLPSTVQFQVGSIFLLRIWSLICVCHGLLKYTGPGWPILGIQASVFGLYYHLVQAYFFPLLALKIQSQAHVSCVQNGGEPSRAKMQSRAMQKQSQAMKMQSQDVQM